MAVVACSSQPTLVSVLLSQSTGIVRVDGEGRSGAHAAKRPLAGSYGLPPEA